MKCCVLESDQHWRDVAEFHKRRWNETHPPEEQTATFRLHPLVHFQARRRPTSDTIGRVADVLQPPAPKDDQNAWLNRIRAKAGE